MTWVEVVMKMQKSPSPDHWAVLFLICQALDKSDLPLPESNDKKETSDEENK